MYILLDKLHYKSWKPCPVNRDLETCLQGFPFIYSEFFEMDCAFTREETFSVSNCLTLSLCDLYAVLYCICSTCLKAV